LKAAPSQKVASAELPERITQEEIEKFGWAPAFRIKRDEHNRVSVEELSLGLDRALGDSIGISEFAPAPDAIPQQIRKFTREAFESSLAYLSGLKSDEKITRMLEDNIYVMTFVTFEGAAYTETGAYIVIPDDGSQFTAIDANAQKTATCPDETLQLVRLGADRSSKTFLHEHLHDAWFNVLGAEQMQRMDALIALFSEGDGLPREDSILQFLAPELGSGMSYSASRTSCTYKGADPRNQIISDFVKSRSPGVSDTAKTDMENALHWHVEHRAMMASAFRKYSDSGKYGGNRNMFASYELYPQLFDHKIIPPFLKDIYSPILTDAALNPAIYGRNSRYLETFSEFEGFMPTIRDFIGYVKSVCKTKEKLKSPAKALEAKTPKD
jgi:hypothetical protein